MAETARRAGMPRDQLERFLSFGYVPQPRQMQFHAACREADARPLSIGFGGARGGSKTHGTFAQICLDDCQRRDGLKFLFLRKLAKAAREAVSDLRRKVLFACPHEYKVQSGSIEFPNGSQILLGHFNYENDIDQYLGLEYDGIAIEEATQLTETKRSDILTCLRTSRNDWRPRDYNTTNPGGVGHGWFKRTFIEPFRTGGETTTRFIPSTVYDNKMVDGDYRGKLEQLTGWKRRAWLEGDWDVAAGQYFSNWDYNAIVREIPDPLPGQLAWCSLDYGFTHPTVAYLMYEFDGTIRVVDEFRAMKKLPEANAHEIKNMILRHGLQVEDLYAFCAGRDVFGQRGAADGRTIADQYADEGLTLTPANDDRVSGAAEILQRLGDTEQGTAPSIGIHPRCSYLINCIPTMQHNPNRPEDVLKVNANEDGHGGDDEYDGFRYGVMEFERLSGSASVETGWRINDAARSPLRRNQSDQTGGRFRTAACGAFA
jgi:phage terminase large subunit